MVKSTIFPPTILPEHLIDPDFDAEIKGIGEMRVIGSHLDLIFAVVIK